MRTKVLEKGKINHKEDVLKYYIIYVLRYNVLQEEIVKIFKNRVYNNYEK